MPDNITFKPHRGRTSIMSNDKKNLVLDNGELFVELPDTVDGDNQYKIKIGDGITTYENLPYAVDPSNIGNSTISTDTSTNMSTARKDDILGLGELFLEEPDSLTGDNQYKIKIGDGITTYENLPYAVDPSNINVSDSSKQDVLLSTPLTIGGNSVTTVEGALSALNDNAGGSSNTILTSTKTLSTTTTTTYTFTDSSITTDSIIDVYTSIFGIAPNSMSVSGTTCTIVFPIYTSASSMTVKIVVINE